MFLVGSFKPNIFLDLGVCGSLNIGSKTKSCFPFSKSLIWMISVWIALWFTEVVWGLIMESYKYLQLLTKSTSLISSYSDYNFLSISIIFSLFFFIIIVFYSFVIPAVCSFIGLLFFSRILSSSSSISIFLFSFLSSSSILIYQMLISLRKPSNSLVSGTFLKVVVSHIFISVSIP